MTTRDSQAIFARLSHMRRHLGNIGYGWVMVFAAAVLIGLGLGGIASVAVFLKPLTAEFGWSRASVSMAYTIASIASAVAGLYFGRVADLHGARLIVWLGTLAFGLSLIALSYQTSLWHLYSDRI